MNFMTTWSVFPKGMPEDAEFFTSEHHALDVAFDWSVEDHGAPMIVQRDGMNWMEVVA
jgi:hypothetical protein